MRQKVLSILALLLMAVSGAWAQAPQTSTLLTTIENGGDNSSFKSGSKTFDGIATVTLNGNISNDGDSWGWYTMLDATIAVTAVGGYTITSCKFYTESGSAEDTQSPFEASVTYDNHYSAWVNGNSIGQYGVLKIEVYGYAPTTVAITGITLSQTEAAMTVGGDALTQTTTVAPDNATDKTVTWASSDASVATVADGVVTAVAAGTATITATANDGSGVTATCEVKVTTLAGIFANGASVAKNFTCYGDGHICTITNSGSGFACNVTGSSADGLNVHTVTVNGNTITVRIGFDSYCHSYVFDATNDHYSFIDAVNDEMFMTEATSFSLNGTDITSQLTKE